MAGETACPWSLYICGAGPWPAAASQAARPRRIWKCLPHDPSVILKRRRLPHLDVLGQAFATMDRLLDQARCGPTFLRQPGIAQLVLASMEYGVEIGHYQLHSGVIMPDHVHLLLTPHVGASKLLGSLKMATAKRANLLLRRTRGPARGGLRGRRRPRACPTGNPSRQLHKCTNSSGGRSPPVLRSRGPAGEWPGGRQRIGYHWDFESADCLAAVLA